MAKELLKTTRKQHSGIGKQQSKGLPTLSITSLPCTRMAKGLIATKRKQWVGTRKQLSKVILSRRSLLDSIITMAKMASRLLDKKLLASSQLRQNRATQAHRSVLKTILEQAVAHCWALLFFLHNAQLVVVVLKTV
jgi:hypothetical protein